MQIVRHIGDPGLSLTASVVTLGKFDGIHLGHQALIGGAVAEALGEHEDPGGRLPRALVFEARESAGAPLAGQLVTFTGINARIEPATVTTNGVDCR